MGSVLRLAAVIGALVLCAASATPYQQKGLSGGYEDQDLGGGKYLITVNVNSYTSSTTAVQYAYRRAGELCPSGYDVLDSKEGTRYTAGGGNLYAHGQATLVVQCR